MPENEIPITQAPLLNTYRLHGSHSTSGWESFTVDIDAENEAEAEEAFNDGEGDYDYNDSGMDETGDNVISEIECIIRRTPEPDGSTTVTRPPLRGYSRTIESAGEEEWCLKCGKSGHFDEDICAECRNK